ncbi:thiol-disulfide oxidoreductase DCC family protein [Saccharopolyspora sp. 5N708]|uniref:thiol-disulfide oxidoreductase DCC family protein n=1 Tax=Saccharopolyspora sp. 5N708 TaxID=3457424 RepID=UPI003FD4D7ED
MTDLPVLIYDGDCGFCTRSVRLAERLPVRMRILAWQEADLASFRTTEDRARHEVLWIARSGRVFGGAAAVAELLRNCRMPWPVLGWLMSAPVLRLLAEWAYRLVAANRFRLPGATPACQLPPEERPGRSDRSGPL